MLGTEAKKFLRRRISAKYNEMYFGIRKEMEVTSFANDIPKEMEKSLIFSAISVKTLERIYFRYYYSARLLEKLSENEVALIKKSAMQDKKIMRYWQNYDRY